MRTKLTLIAAALSLLAPVAAFADDDAAPKTETNVTAPKPANGGYVVPQSVLYEGGKLPEGATLEKRPNMALIGTGLGIFAAAYVPSIITAAVACAPQKDCSATGGAAWLYFPIVGPFITAANSTSVGGAALAAFDGGLQVTGAAIAIAGLIAQRKFVVWQDKSAKLTVTPGAGNNAGLSLTLTHM